jgi:hypothetical protein
MIYLKQDNLYKVIALEIQKKNRILSISDINLLWLGERDLS